MKLTALDIRKQEFKKVLRGYDPLEVEAFLEMVSDEYETLSKSKSEFVDRINMLESRIQEFEKIETTLQKTLVDAQKSADRSRQDTEKETDIVLKDAELQAAKITDEAKREAARLKSEITMLQNQKRTLTSRLKQLLSSNLELIKVLELEDVDIEGIKQRQERGRIPGGAAPSAPRSAVTPVPKPAEAPAKPVIPAAKPAPPEQSARSVKTEPVQETAKPKDINIKESAGTVRREPAPSPQKGDMSDLIDRMILKHEEEEDIRDKGKNEGKDIREEE